MVIDIIHSPPWNLPPLLSWKGLRKRRWRLGRGLGANDVEAKGTKGKILSQKSELTDVCVHQGVMQQWNSLLKHNWFLLEVGTSSG